MKLEGDVPCPACGETFKERVERMRPGVQRNCPHCDATITYEGDDGSKIQRELDKLEKMMRRLGR
jgi:endogenous inhibitor of DNA gyrase (YacG/DUF329 family)